MDSWHNEREILEKIEKILVHNDVDQIDFLVDVLANGPTPMVREAASECLKSLASPEVPRKVVKLLNSPDAYVRNTATTILAKQWPLSCEVLVELLDNDNKHIRKYALDALFLTSSPEAIALCARLLHDTDVNNVIAAVEYLGKTYDKAYIDDILQVLEKSLRSKEEMLTLACLEALVNLCEESCFDSVRKIIPSPEELPEILIPSYLRLFSKICRIQDSVVLILLSSTVGERFYKEIIDAFRDYLSKYYEQLDEIQRELLFSWMSKIYEEFNLPSQNKYEILMIMFKLQPDKVKAMIPDLLREANFFLNISAIELIEMLRTTEFLKDLRHFVERMKTLRRKFLDSLFDGNVSDSCIDYELHEIELLIDLGETTVQVLETDSQKER